MLFVPEHSVLGQAPEVSSPDHKRRRCDRITLPPSVAFLQRFGIDKGVLFENAYHAQKLGVGTEEALINGGVLSQEQFYRLLAEHLNVPYIDTIVPLAPTACRRRCAQAGVAPLAPNAAGLNYVLAPRGAALHSLLANFAPFDAAPQFALTTPAHLSRLALTSQSRKIADEASLQLQADRPDLSALQGFTKSEIAALSSVAGALAVGAFALPVVTMLAIYTALALVFGAAVFLRLCAVCASLLDRSFDSPPLSDAELPVYSLVLPVYREKNVVHKLDTSKYRDFGAKTSLGA